MLTHNAPLRRYFLFAILPVGLMLLSVAVQFFALNEWLRYDRQAILAGQLWRLLTGHIAHLGPSHLWLNVLGLALVWLLFGRLQSIGQWLWHIMLTGLAVSAGLLWLNPEIHWYVGLSGVLHGIFTIGLCVDVRRQMGFTLLVAGIFAAKLLWEQYFGPLPGSEQSAGGPVVVDAHLYGALGACGSYMLIFLGKYVKKSLIKR